MEKNDYKKKVFILLALAISVLGLSVGFAAFSQTLSIRSDAEVNPDNTFSSNVKFSGDPTCDADVPSLGNLSTENTTWEGLKVQLKKPGDSVTCTVTVSNASVYDAFLKEISFTEKLSCESDSSSNAEKICSADGVKATVSAGSNSASVTGAEISNKTEIKNNIISAGATDTITFKVEYLDSGSYVDNDVAVTIPELKLVYSSSDE